jgi:peptide/nickel transport system substrate-binding protein
MRGRFNLLLVLFLSVLFISSCTYKRNPTEVVVWQLADPGVINPVTAADAVAYEIDNNVFQPLLNFDYRTLKLVPILADSLPQVRADSAGHMYITYELRKEAKWDNGTPITAKDVEFTFKAACNPGVNDAPLKTTLDLLSDLILYPDNPRKITFVFKARYNLAVETTGTNTCVLPEYAYDPKKYMEGFTFKQMLNDTALAHDPKMMAFANDFNSEKYQRDTTGVNGSGAYQFVEWTTGQRVVLRKKRGWWGDALAGTNCFFEAYPDKIVYQVVNDQTTALVSLKAGNLDVMKAIKPQDFTDLSKSDKFTANFNTLTPLMFAYTYLGINMKEPKLADVHTRQALAHLVDVKRIIQDVYYGYGQQVTGGISPMDSLDYNSDIKPYEYNLDSAKALLAAAGWTASEGDGILYKVIDGKKTPFTIDFLVNQGADVRKKVALIFKEEARKVGIDVNIVVKEFNVFQGLLKKHEFDMYTSGWVFQPGQQDFKQVFYSTSALDEGSNHEGFGDATSDALIDSMRVELDVKKRAGMEKRLQVIMHDRCGYIFLLAPKALIAISKKFSNAYASSNNPFFWEAGFKAAGEK